MLIAANLLGLSSIWWAGPRGPWGTNASSHDVPHPIYCIEVTAANYTVASKNLFLLQISITGCKTNPPTTLAYSAESNLKFSGFDVDRLFNANPWNTYVYIASYLITSIFMESLLIFKFSCQTTLYWVILTMIQCLFVILGDCLIAKCEF